MFDIVLGMKRNCKGNVLIYVLLAVALLAALTYSISNDNTGTQQNQLTAAQVKLLAGELINHATSAQMAVQQMTAFGVNYEDIKFDLPGTAGYNVDPTLQIYHPRGGGVEISNVNSNSLDLFWNSTTDNWNKWYLSQNTNVEWTPSTQSDLIYSFGALTKETCEQINNQIYGDTFIPNVSPFSWRAHFQNSSSLDFLASECPECEGKKSMCISGPFDPVFYLFYNVIGSR